MIQKVLKVARNYSYVASTKAIIIKNGAANQLLTINYLCAKQKTISHGFIAILSSLSLAYSTSYTLIKEELYVPFMLLFA